MSPLTRPDFPLCWDNTLRSSFVECPRKMYWEYLQHFKPIFPSIHLHAGGAWAAGLEETRRAFYEHGLSPHQAQSLGLEKLVVTYGDFTPPERGSGALKSLERLLEAFAYYWSAFPLETDPAQPYRTADGKPMVEFSFALPLDPDRVRHPVTDEPIIYTGRADMIATYAGAVTIYDDKTTTALGAQWATSWTRRSQFTGYSWAAREYGIPTSQVLVRGIAILKSEIKHGEVITVRTPHHITEWHEQACRDILRAIECWKSGYWDVNLADACSSYGGCIFQQPCTSSNPDPWLLGGFSRRVWNPLTREEEAAPNPLSEN